MSAVAQILCQANLERSKKQHLEKHFVKKIILNYLNIVHTDLYVDPYPGWTKACMHMVSIPLHVFQGYNNVSDIAYMEHTLLFEGFY